jgi:hypothetical protein
MVIILLWDSIRAGFTPDYLPGFCLRTEQSMSEQAGPSGNTSGLYLSDSWFEIQPEHGLS